MKGVRQGKANIEWYRLYVESKKQYKGTKQKKTDTENKLMLTKLGRGDKQGVGN